MLKTNQKLLIVALTLFCAAAYSDTKIATSSKSQTSPTPDRLSHYLKVETGLKDNKKTYIADEVALKEAYVVAMSRRDENRSASDTTQNSDYSNNDVNLSDNEASDRTTTTTTSQTADEPSTGMGNETTSPTTNTRSKNVSKTTNTNNPRGSTTTSPINTPTAAGDADTSARTSTPKAQSQSTTRADAELTRKIRQDLMNTDLSTAAKNVTITTINGAVTLSGEVASMQEKNRVGDVAKAYARSVKNQIAVKP